MLYPSLVSGEPWKVVGEDMGPLGGGKLGWAVLLAGNPMEKVGHLTTEILP